MTATFVTLCLIQIARFSQIWVGLTRQLYDEYSYSRMKSGLSWTTNAGPTQRVAHSGRRTSRFVADL